MGTIESNGTVGVFFLLSKRCSADSPIQSHRQKLLKMIIEHELFIWIKGGEGGEGEEEEINTMG